MYKKPVILAFALIILLLAGTIGHITTPTTAQDQEGPDAECIACHSSATPGIVQQYLRGAMGSPGIQNPDVAEKLGGMERVPCTTCHGTTHTNADDWRDARLPDHTICQGCHGDQVTQFLAGKHALAWQAMMAIPMTQKMPKQEVLFGCGGCHKIGVKSEEDLISLGLDRPYGIGGTCDQCHTRHTFSTIEARQPEACAKCHMGFDHPQWEMWSKSKHGNIYFAHKDEYPFNISLKYITPSDYPGPTCQLCHMPKGNHTVITPWGFIALVAFTGRPDGLTIVNDPEWEVAKVEMLKALRVLDPQGNPTALLQAVAELKLVRLTPEEFMDARMRLYNTCTECHSEVFIENYLTQADRIVKNSTIQLATAIDLIATARQEGILPPRPDEPNNPYPFLLNFYEEPSGVEREVWLMFLEYRMRTFQGMFHVNPDYTHWYGWSEMRRALGDVAEIIEEYATIKGINETTIGLEAYLAGNMSSIQELFQQTQAKLKSLDQNLMGLNQTLSTLETQLTQIQDQISSTNNELQQVKAKQDTLDAKQDQLANEQGRLSSELDSLKQESTSMKSSIRTALIVGIIALILSIISIALAFKPRT